MNSVLKTHITQIHVEPPGQPNNIMVTASGPSTLTVTWMAPITNKDIVTEYFIQCDSVDDDLPPQNTTRRSSLSAPFYNLTPNTTYECTVIALSPFGNSDPATAQAMTPPRESKFLCMCFIFLCKCIYLYIYIYIYTCVHVYLYRYTCTCRK